MNIAISGAAFARASIIKTIFALTLAVFAWHSPSAFAINGTKNIPGDYPDLAAAITDLNTLGVDGAGVTLNVVAGNPQTAPAGGYSITTLTGAVGTPIVIQGNGNTITASAALTVGALTDSIFKVIGTDFVTISGFTMQENAANTVTAAATNNMTEWGVALLYTTTTDGAQNITIQNNTITLNRTYQNTFGIYSNSTHTATTVTTSATATTTAGANSGLKVYTNNISNVNIGIVVVGPTAAADNNDGLDIGGVALATGNTLTNYGTTGTFSGYANVSGTVNGILVRNTKNFNVSFNTVTSSIGGTTAGTLRGIYVPSFTNAPTGTIVDTINNNNISVQSGLAGGVINGINLEATTVNTTTTLSINNNNFNTSGHTVAGTAAITFITDGGLALNQTINNNTFTNMSVNTTGAVTFISIGAVAVPATGSLAINGNSIVTGFTKTGAGGSVSFYTNNASPVNGSLASISNNVISNVSVTGAAAFTGISSTDGASATSGPTKTISGNTISAISGGTGVLIAMTVNFSGAASTVSANTISNITWGGAATGLTFGTSNQTISATGNTINTISTTTGAVIGITTAAPTTTNISKNKIYDLNATNATSTVSGIVVSAGATINVFNNLVGDLRAPAANAANPVIGINLTSTTAASALNVSYNTVQINATSSGAVFGSSGISHAASATATTAALNLRNNVVVNTSTANTTGLTVAYRRSGVALNNYVAASNNNDFYAGTPSATNLIFTDGTNSDQTLAAYRTRVASRDSFSVSENPPFLSTVGSNPNFLHIDPTIATQLESGGTPVAGITDDFDGNTRNGSTPDIGADEFTGILLDLFGPSISYTAFVNTSLTTNRVLTATITDPSGIATGGNAPRIYFRKNAGAYFSTQCAGSSPTYSCTIDNALVGGVTAADLIEYYVIAQDNPGNVNSNPSAGLVAANVNTVTTPPTTPNSYTVVAAIPPSVNVGAAETITSLTNTGGLFQTINAGALNANVVVNITSDLVAETGTVALNQFNEDGVGGYTLTIQPSGGVLRSIIGTNATALIVFNGADRVTINGLNAGGNSLLIRDTAATGSALLYSNDASNNSLLNSTIEGGSTGTLVNIGVGTVTGNDNIQIVGNTIRDRTDVAGVSFNGVGSTAVSLTVTNSNLFIDNNQITNFNQAGVFIGVGSDNVTITGNNISQTATRTTQLIGIAINGMLGTNLISRNSIHDLVASGTVQTSGILLNDARATTISRNRIFNFPSVSGATGPLVGIQFNGSSANPASVNVVNNMVSIVPAFANAQQVRGIFDFAFAGNTFTANHNTVFVGGTASGAASSWALMRADLAPTAYSARNNIAYNNRTGGTGNHFAGGDQSAAAGTFDSNFNFFVGTGATAANFMDRGTAAAGTPVSFATWQAGPPARDANSIANTAASFIPTDFFVDLPNSDLHIKATAPVVINAGTPVAGVTTDFDGDLRSPFTPTIGADEGPLGVLTITPPTVNFGNQAVGVASSENTVTLANTGTGSLDVTVLTAAAAPFARTATGTCAATLPITIAAGTNCTLTYTFTPTVTGPASQTLTVTSSALGSGTIGLSGTGVQGNLTITPTTVPFGTVTIGNTGGPNTVTLANTGTASLNVTALTAAAAPFARTAGGTCSATLPITIAAGTNCTLTYTFTPTAAVTSNQTLTVTANAPGSGTIDLSGTGTAAPVGNLTITPTTVPFGTVTIGNTGGPNTVTLANTGTASLNVTALTAAAAPFARTAGGTCSATLPITIAAGANCTLTYTYTPTAAVTSNQSLTVTANAPGSGTIALSGTGSVAPVGNLTITPTTVPFGNQTVGTTSAASTVTLANTGTASLNVTVLTAAATPFARTGAGSCSATLPITIAAGANCTLTYTFAPTATGAANQVLTVTTPANGSGTITLTGTGIQGTLTISPTTVPFGNVQVGNTSAASTVTLGNSGTASLNVTALTAAATPFARTVAGTCSATLPITIAAGSSCTLTYTFAPTAAGAANQTLTVTANAPGSGTIALSGTGLQGNLTIAPTPVNFGNVGLGQLSALGTITLGNNGTASLNITTLTTATAPFIRTTDGTCGNSLPITIAIGASCTVTYRFGPTALGAATQMFTVGSNASGATTYTLNGNGVPAVDPIFSDGFE